MNVMLPCHVTGSNAIVDAQICKVGATLTSVNICA